ncbi:MAG TPA: TlpA disulfide reductase family protein [Candidatus Eremiobacteraceae bacterium]|nr:TlpA disulfide reductase family protein [Candidatus Eremiobacteraceae bacterium]
MKLGDSAPAFDDRVEWLDGAKAAPRIGLPLLVHFWSHGCPLCHDGAELVNEWRAKLGVEVLDMIAVFSPRPESTSVDVAAVQRDALELMQMNHPCAIDRRGELRAIFECPFSPGYFVFDRDGKLRHRQMGNNALASVGALLDRLTVKASSSSGA